MKHVFVALGILLGGCSSKVPVPPFDVEVVLTAAAQGKLEASGETIRLRVFFDGDGESKAGQDTAPFRAVYLGDHELELRRPGRVRIGDAKVDEGALRRLSDPNYHFTINIVSGRRAFNDNVLVPAAVFGRLSDLSPTTPVRVSSGLLEDEPSEAHGSMK